jgi:putative YphP/YqiW family bacilliredoxin
MESRRLAQAQGMYDERMVAPMREELTRIGFEELRTTQQVDERLGDEKGTTLVVVNSICGCAARNARPAVSLALQQAASKPDHLATVFAGQDRDATQRARGYFTGYPPSSPSIGLLKDGAVVFMLERWQIEGRPAAAIAEDLRNAMETHCG